MGTVTYTYEDVIQASIKACWQIEDVLPRDVKIMFDRPHLPDTLADVDRLEFLDVAQRRTLNHLRGLSYMNLFAFVEEYIIAQTVKHAEAEMFGDHEAVRALLRFGEEEIKHQTLFKRYCQAFQRDFGRPCRLLGSAAEVANAVLSNSPIAVMLATLHLEIMTQRHYTDAVRDDADVDPLVESILRRHWMEESQHVRIDLLELVKMTTFATPESIRTAIDEYVGIVAALDGLLGQQVEMDLENLVTATGVALDGYASELKARQQASYRKDFLLMGMTHPKFIGALAALDAAAPDRIGEVARTYGASGAPG